MRNVGRAWLVLCHGDDRDYGGNTGYADQPERLNRYDTDVQNHRRIARGDILFLRDRTQLIGIAQVDRIRKWQGPKIRRRCPACAKTAINERRTKKPTFRCKKCGSEFDAPVLRRDQVTKYKAEYERTFLRAKTAVSKTALRAACPASSDQQSIRPMDPSAARRLVEGQSNLLSLVLHGSSEKRRSDDTLTGPSDRSKRRGRGGTAERRRAVELHAMDAAIAYYTNQGWQEVKDVSRNRSYDLLCVGSQGQLRVEVKGTTSDGSLVSLTRNEVRNAKALHPWVALFILAEIRTRTSSSGAIRASGGEVIMLDPWTVEEDDLEATDYAYSVPEVT